MYVYIDQAFCKFYIIRNYYYCYFFFGWIFVNIHSFVAKAAKKVQEK